MPEESAHICNTSRRLRRSRRVARTTITVGSHGIVGVAMNWRESNATAQPEVRTGPPEPVDLQCPNIAITRVKASPTETSGALKRSRPLPIDLAGWPYRAPLLKS